MTEITNRTPQKEAMAIALALPSGVLESVLRERYELEGQERVSVLLESCPLGCVPHQVLSSYYGSHSEYGIDDDYFWVAIPEGSALPEMQIRHGSYSCNRDDLALLPVGSYVNWGDGWEAVLSWRLPVPLEQPLLVPDKFIAVEAIIIGDYEGGLDGGMVHALQWPGHTERAEGETPKFYRYGSFSDVEYFDYRSEEGHYWKQQGSD